MPVCRGSLVLPVVSKGAGAPFGKKRGGAATARAGPRVSSLSAFTARGQELLPLGLADAEVLEHLGRDLFLEALELQLAGAALVLDIGRAARRSGGVVAGVRPGSDRGAADGIAGRCRCPASCRRGFPSSLPVFVGSPLGGIFALARAVGARALAGIVAGGRFFAEFLDGRGGAVAIDLRAGLAAQLVQLFLSAFRFLLVVPLKLVDEFLDLA